MCALTLCAQALTSLTPRQICFMHDEHKQHTPSRPVFSVPGAPAPTIFHADQHAHAKQPRVCSLASYLQAYLHPQHIICTVRSTRASMQLSQGSGGAPRLRPFRLT